MDPTLTWLDLTASDRDKMRQVLDLFNEQGTVDEMGLGTLRDALSEALFPGTSTIQTRLRYVLFVPWIYRQLESRRVVAASVPAQLRKAELDLEPLVTAADLGGALRISRNSLARMDTLLSTPPLAEPPAGTEAQPEGADIEFDGVRFAYGDLPVLDDVSFVIPERQITALVGPSGAGKTTVLRLIARFWDVDAGTVRVGGIDVRDIPTERLMARLSAVFQDVYLFDGSIEENIRIGRPEASDGAVREAARLAGVDEIVARLPQGFAARAGEGGAALSGGERQRVSIARAILKDAPVVLLDEATAALDPINEAAVHRGLRALTREKTLVVVAHRLQTVRAADRILFLDRGRIVEQGTHDDLIATGNRYAAFWNERTRAAGWRLSGSAGGAGSG